MKLGELLRNGIADLLEAGVVEYEVDAMLLLQHCSGKSRTEIYLSGNTEASLELKQEYYSLLCRRKLREPVAYIVGEREFWSLPFHVNQDVLIPRPETEFLLDRVFALTDAQNFVRGNILDLCCGSGVICTVLAIETGKRVVASDISGSALQVARLNTASHRMDHLVRFVQGNLLNCFPLRSDFSLVVSNPPYVSNREISEDLAPEVVQYEPHLALDGGDHGMEIIEQIREDLPGVLMPGGQCFIEIGAAQGREVLELFRDSISGCPDFQYVEILKDYAGRDRVLHARLTK
ncbi:MAG: peptide chain release factor N(5)-glutamine methyltransferase [Desulforhopalus sp.]